MIDVLVVFKVVVNDLEDAELVKELLEKNAHKLGDTFIHNGKTLGKIVDIEAIVFESENKNPIN